MRPARFESMFDRLVAETAGTSGADALQAWARLENAACARRMTEIVTMLDALYAADGSVDRDQWCLDNWGAACAQIGAAQQSTPGAASRLLLIGTTLRDRLPKVGALFSDGLITFRLVATIAHRTTLIRDLGALRAVDSALAAAVLKWGTLSLDKTDLAIDKLIAEFDPYALRRTQDKARGRALPWRRRGVDRWCGGRWRTRSRPWCAGVDRGRWRRWRTGCPTARPARRRRR